MATGAYDFSGFVSGTAKIDPANIKFDAGILGDAATHHDAALKHFVKDGEHFKLDSGTTDFTETAKGVKAIEERLASARQSVLDQKDIQAIEAELKTANDSLTKNGKEALEFLGKGADLQAKAAEELAKAKEVRLNEIQEAFKAERAKLHGADSKLSPEQLQEQLAVLGENEKAVITATEKNFADAVKQHADLRPEIEKAAANIEKTTGAKVAEHAKNLKGGFFSNAKGATTGMFSEFAENVAGHWKRSGFAGRARVGCGMLVGATALYSAGKDVFGEKEKDAQGQEIDKSIFWPIAKLGVGAAAVILSARGGAAFARGVA